MSRLYASIDSDARKTQATSRGHKRIDAHVRGWAVGVRVEADTSNDRDEFHIYATSGSSPDQSEKLLGFVYREPGEDGAPDQLRFEPAPFAVAQVGQSF